MRTEGKDFRKREEEKKKKRKKLLYAGLDYDIFMYYITSQQPCQINRIYCCPHLTHEKIKDNLLYSYYSNTTVS